MSTSFPLKLAFLLLFISFVSVGCSGDPDAEVQSALHRAVDIYFGESDESDIQPALERLRQAVADGGNPDATYEGASPLYLAIWENDMELATLLIDHGADVSARDLDQDGEPDYPPLLIAIVDSEEINPDMIALLIKAGSEVNSNGDFQPPLAAAVEAGSMSTVKTLLQAGADPDGLEDWDTPLEQAAEDGNIEMFDLLRASGAKPRNTGYLLSYAAGSSNPEMLQRVLPLHSGSNEDLRLFEMALIGLLDDRDDEVRRSGAKSVMEQLRAAGFEPKPEEFNYAMPVAAESLDIQALETMFLYGASASTADESGKTCLMQAIDAAGLGKIVELETPPESLFELQDTQVADVVRLLLNHGADVNAQDKRGRTALMRATTTFNVSSVRLLLEQGADRNLVDEKGQTALDLMLSSKLLQENKDDTAGRMMQALVGFTPEFRRLAKTRAEQIRIALE